MYNVHIKPKYIMTNHFIAMTLNCGVVWNGKSNGILRFQDRISSSSAAKDLDKKNR